MRCRHADRLMSLQLDGAIRPADAQRLSAHLARCARCQGVWATLRQADGLFSSPPLPEPAPDLTARVLARLPAERRAVIPPAPAWTRASVIVAAALGLVLLGVTGALVLTGVAVGTGDWTAAQQGGRSVVAAAWSGLQAVGSALRDVVWVLWRAFRWPWLPVAGGVALVAGVVWGWLWARGGRANRD